MEYIFPQTDLETILIEACSLKNINKLVKEKRTNKLKNLIVVDTEEEPDVDGDSVILRKHEAMHFLYLLLIPMVFFLQ